MKQLPNELLPLDLLNVLLNDDEPLVSMLSDMIRLGYNRGQSTAAVFDELEQMEQLGLVESRYWTQHDAQTGGRPPTQNDLARERDRLPSFGAALDIGEAHVGLWYHATLLGTKVWHDHEGPTPRDEQWRITELTDGGMQILAADERVALAAVDRWKGQNIGRSLRGPTRIERGVTFSISGGTVVNDGLRLFYLMGQPLHDASRH